MFIRFFLDLRQHGLKVSIREYLTLLEALEAGMERPGLEEFYYLSRSILIKHEEQLDAFDVLFGQHFRGKQRMDNEDFWKEIPEEWIRNELEKVISPEDLEAIEEMGGLDALIDRFRELMAEQDERHEGGNTYIGTGGTSKFGNSGFNTEGIRAGGRSGFRRALKVWDRRQYANLNDKVELDTRNMKMVMKRLRVLTREGRPTELDLKKTIRRTSENAGMIDIHMRPSRKNRVKVLLLLDIGGSMDDHVHRCEQLFSAARHEFKHLEHYYFHNCLYDFVWRDNRRRYEEKIPTWQLLHTYNKDYKVIFVGDAAMSPIEVMYRGGSVEYFNEEPGWTWLERMHEQFESLVWINPIAERNWGHFESTRLIRKAFHQRMFPMTIAGLGAAMEALKDPRARYGDPDPEPDEPLRGGDNPYFNPFA